MTIGSEPAPVDPAFVQATIGAAIGAESLAKQTRGGSASRSIAAAAIVLAFSAILIVGGLFLVRVLEVGASSKSDWRATQLAVPQIKSEIGTGSGFVIEDEQKLWLVTNYHVIEGVTKVDVLFRDPSTGETLFPLRAIPTAEFKVHARFLELNELSADGRTYDFALYCIEPFRPNLERAGIQPLRLVNSGSVAPGERVVALGHPGSAAFDLAAEGDSAARNVATHSIFEGIVSSVRVNSGKPTLVQTTAPFAGGCSGGPLVLESARVVVGVNTWSEVDQSSGGSKEGMRFSLAADQTLDVLRGGTTLGEVRGRIEAAAREATPPAGNTGEAVSWATFGSLDSAVGSLMKRGWKIASQAIVVTAANGRFDYSHKAQSGGRSNVAVLVLPRDRSIDADINDISAPGFRGLGKAMDFTSGSLEAVFVRLPESEELASVQQGVDFKIALATYFLGEPIAARVAVIVLERPIEEAEVAPTPQGAGSPPASGSAPPPSAGSMASRAKVDPSYCNSEVYASSLLGMEEFDRRWLPLGDETGAASTQPLRDALVPPLTEEERKSLTEVHAVLRAIREASLAYAVETFVGSRPVLNLLIEGVPPNTAVGVYLKADPHGDPQLLPVGQTLLVSAADSTPLVRGQVDLRFPWDSGALRRLTQPVDLRFELRVRFGDGTEKAVRHQIRVLPPCDVEMAYPCGLSMVTLVDPQHPYVLRLVNEINARPALRRQGITLTGTGGSAQNQLESVFLIWKELAERGLRYQNLVGTTALGAQRIRPVHESLSTNNANCIDGAVLFASLLEAVGFDVCIVLVPGHALVGVSLEDRVLFIETTLLGREQPDDPDTGYNELFDASSRSNPFFSGPEWHLFEFACAMGWYRIDQDPKDGLAAAKASWEAWGELLKREPVARGPDGAWKPQHLAALQQMQRQLQVIWVKSARALGVRSLGSPSDIEQRFPFPK